LQTLCGFRHDLFFRVSQGALPFLQVLSKRKCQYLAKPPKEGKVAVKVEKSAKVEKLRPKFKEKAKGETKRMGLREVCKLVPKARHEPAVVAGPSQFPGSMSTNVPAVRAKALEKVGYWVGTNLVGKPVSTQYTKAWDFSAIGDEGRLSLGVIRLQVQVLMHQIELLNVELRVLIDMEEAMFDTRLEAGDEMEEGEFADKELSDFE
jgi:hypothetical protein